MDDVGVNQPFTLSGQVFQAKYIAIRYKGERIRKVVESTAHSPTSQGDFQGRMGPRLAEETDCDEHHGELQSCS
jgi:hypothetical protein